jgi:hypothetical protein
VLAEILRRGNDDFVSRYAAKNPNCPPEVLAEVLRRGKDDSVSCCAAENPNCPSEVLRNFERSKDVQAMKEIIKRNNWSQEELIWNLYPEEVKDIIVSRITNAISSLEICDEK